MRRRVTQNSRGRRGLHLPGKELERRKWLGKVARRTTPRGSWCKLYTGSDGHGARYACAGAYGNHACGVQTPTIQWVMAVREVDGPGPSRMLRGEHKVEQASMSSSSILVLRPYPLYVKRKHMPLSGRLGEKFAKVSVKAIMRSKGKFKSQELEEKWRSMERSGWRAWFRPHQKTSSEGYLRASRSVVCCGPN